jgi:hypothetical protein
LDAAAIKKINGKLGGNYVRSVDIVFDKASVIDISDVDAINAGRKGVDAACLEAIKYRLSLNQPVTIIRSSLIGNVTYKVTFDASVSAQAQASYTQQISGDIAASLENKGSGQLTGDGLAFGVKDSTTQLQELVGNLPQAATPATSAIANALQAQVRLQGDSLINAGAVLAR